jgi:hypothetical protein
MVRWPDRRDRVTVDAVAESGHPLGVLCMTAGCHHRANVSADWIRVHQADITELLDLRLKCTRCGGRETQLYLFDTADEVERFLYGGPYG